MVKSMRTAFALGLAATLACGDDGTGPGSGLRGTWRASAVDAGTHFTFEEHAGPGAIDFVDSVAATVTLAVQESTFTLTVSVPIFGVVDSRAGGYRSTVDSLTIVDTATDDTLGFTFTLAGSRLTILHTAGRAAWDFNNDMVDDSADVSAVFRRQ